MTPIVCLTGTHNLGISFLDWSLHWLSGANKVYHWQQGWQPMVANPLTAINSHLHARNHVDGLEQTQAMVQLLQQVPAPFHTVYPTPPRSDFQAQTQGLDQSVMQNQPQWQYLIDQCQREYAELWQWCHRAGCQRIFVATEIDNQVYHAQSRDRAQHAVMFADVPVQRTFLHMHELFFYDNLAQSDTVWDRREIMALNLQWNQPQLGHEYLDMTLPHIWINCREFWYHGTELLPLLLQNLNIGLDLQRWPSWQSTYHSWQKINYQCLEFQYKLPHIVESIVQGWYYPLPDLTFLQEVIILHLLMYEHGLNVKSWQLEHFPNNTQKLHRLLEPNQHTLGRSTA